MIQYYPFTSHYNPMELNQKIDRIVVHVRLIHARKYNLICTYIQLYFILSVIL